MGTRIFYYEIIMHLMQIVIQYFNDDNNRPNNVNDGKKDDCDESR